jgi:hypothetical protein
MLELSTYKIQHHFIQDHFQKDEIELIHVDTKNQIVNIFIKLLNSQQHCKLKFKLGMLEFND